MTSINPTDNTAVGPTGTQPLLGTGSTGPQSTGGSGTLDLIEASPPLQLNFFHVPPSSNPLLAAPAMLSIRDFEKIFLSATTNLQHVTQQGDVSDALSNKNVKKALAAEAQALGDLLTNLLIIAQEEAQYTKQQNQATDQLNQAIQNYNQTVGSTNSHIQDFNSAVTDYQTAQSLFQQGLISQSQFDTAKANFQAAIATYNAYASGPGAQATAQLNAAITAYNTATAQNNQLLAQINAARSGVNNETAKDWLNPLDPLPSLPLQSGPPVVNPNSELQNPTQIALQQPVNTLPTSQTPDTKTSLVTTIFAPFFSVIFPQILFIGKMLQVTLDYRDFLMFNLKGRDPTLPDAFINPIPEPQIDSSAGVSTGSGVGLALMITSLNPNAIQRILSTSIYQAATNLETQSPTPNTIESIKFFGLNVLARAGLEAGYLALAILPQNQPFFDPRGSPSQVALGLAFATNILKNVNDSSVEENILRLLTEGTPLSSQSDLNQLTAFYKAAFNLSLLGTALTQISQATGLPNLPTQVIGNLQDQQVAQGVLQATQTANDVLTNQLSVAILNDTLKQVLIRDNAKADTIIANAVNRARLDHSIKTEADFNQALLQELLKEGVTAAQASNLSNLATDFVRAEAIALFRLDLAFNPLHVRNGNSALLGLTAAEASALIDNAIAGGPRNRRDFRNLLAAELQANLSISHGNALKLASQFVASFEANPFAPGSILAPSLLAQQVTNHVTGLLSPQLGAAKAQEIANDVVIALFGPTSMAGQVYDELTQPHSLLNSINAQIRTLRESQSDEVTAAIVDVLRASIGDKVDVYKFTQQLIEPGHIFLSLYGLPFQDSKTKPSNFNNELEFQA